MQKNANCTSMWEMIRQQNIPFYIKIQISTYLSELQKMICILILQVYYQATSIWPHSLKHNLMHM